MFQNLLQLATLQKIVLNTLFVSIPEELFLVMFTLILIGEFDYWKEEECKKLIHRWDYSRILIPTLAAALLSNILRYTFVDIDISSPVTILTVFVLIVLTNDIFGDASALKWMAKAFVFLVVACIVVGLSEFVYVPFILYSTGKTLEKINSDIFMNVLVSLPSRIIQYSILLYFVSQKRTLLKGNVLKYIVESPILALISAVVALCDLLFCIVTYKLIVYEKILINISLTSQISIIIGVIIFPVLNILGLVWSVYYVKNKEMSDKKIASEKLNNLLDSIKSYTYNANYDNIKWKLNEIGMGIEEISTKLFADNKKGKNRE